MAIPQIAQNDESFAIDAPPLCLTFRRNGAQWSHELRLGSRRIAQSVEWDPDRDDPSRVVSPAYQDIHGQHESDGVVAQALLVGQWGVHHGSGVFAVVEEGPDVRIDVDVAVRSRAEIVVLASTYWLELSSGDLIDAGPSAIVWGIDSPTPGRLRFEAGTLDAGQIQVGLAEAGRRAMRVQAVAEVDPSLKTHRLRYTWRWCSA